MFNINVHLCKKINQKNILINFSINVKLETWGFVINKRVCTNLINFRGNDSYAW